MDLQSVGSNTTKVAACPQCRNTSGNVILFQGLNADFPQAPSLPIIRCGSCNLVFTDPQAVTASPDELYFEGYYGEKKRDSLPSRWGNALFQWERQRLSFGAEKPRTVLDVGCGDGTYLRYLPKSLQRSGYEPSAAGQKSLAEMGLKFFDINQPSNGQATHFDLITMWQSLEHVDEPDVLLQKLKPLLGGGGALFVSVPNFASLESKVYRMYWNHLDPTRHLFHYTEETLFRLLRRNGFEIEFVTTFSLEYGVFGWWQSFFNLLRIDFNMAYKILKRRKAYPKTFQHTKALLIHAVLGLPLAFLALGLTVIDSMLARGAVIQARVRVSK